MSLAILATCCLVSSIVCFMAGVGAAYMIHRDEMAAMVRHINELEELLEDAQDENPLWFVNRSYERN